MNFNAYWPALINHWVRVKRRNGLTVPFILGTKTIIDSESKIVSQDIGKLFNDIVSYPGDEVFTLQHCENVGEYVLGLNSVNPKEGLTILNKDTGKPKLIATLNTSVLGKNYEAIVTSLTHRYHDCLNNGLYSRFDFKWTAFSKEDLKMINEVLGL